MAGTSRHFWLMATKDDTRAALLLLALALAGAFVRLLGLGGASPGEMIRSPSRRVPPDGDIDDRGW